MVKSLKNDMLVDTRGDGRADAKIIDTTGDGRPDTIVYLTDLPVTPGSRMSIRRPSLGLWESSRESKSGSALDTTPEVSSGRGEASRRLSGIALGLSRRASSHLGALARRRSSFRGSTERREPPLAVVESLAAKPEEPSLAGDSLTGYGARASEASATDRLSAVESEARARRRSILAEVTDDARIPWESIAVGELLGTGSTGVVCRGEFAGTPVAVKLLHQRHAGEEMLGRLAAECQLALRLRHPNVLITMGFASDGEGKHGMVLELIEGGSLRQLLDSPARLSWARPLLSIATDVCRGMAYLHDRKVVHRDLKPGNVMLGPPPQYHPKVSDFSESRQVDDSKTMTVAGTPSFVAPEVLRQERSGPGSDVWSFAAMLCHMATRAPPYSRLASSVPSYRVMQQVAQGQLSPSLEAREASWPRGLLEVAVRCEASDPEERPAFEALVVELGAIADAAAAPAAAPADARGRAATLGAAGEASPRSASARAAAASRKPSLGEQVRDFLSLGAPSKRAPGSREASLSVGSPPRRVKSGAKPGPTTSGYSPDFERSESSSVATSGPSSGVVAKLG